MITLVMKVANLSRQRIRQFPDNPRYWQYKGEPVLLLGGSDEDNLFQKAHLEEQLDAIAECGGNFVRNTMSDRDPGDLRAFGKDSQEVYDLEKWNEEYWSRLTSLLEGAYDREIIVQIEVWDRFDYSRKEWLSNPYNPCNNCNYGYEESGLADSYPAHPSYDQHPFFHSVKGMAEFDPRYETFATIQRSYVTKLVETVVPFPNVLLCMDNETSTDPKWGRYWMEFIRREAERRKSTLIVTDMFDDAWAPSESQAIAQAIEKDDLYDFLEVSQINSRNFGVHHGEAIRWLRRATEERPRPLNMTKVYSDGNTWYGSGTPREGVDRFWRALLGGIAAIRFHRPPGGLGNNLAARACIRSARRAIESVHPWEMQPRQELLIDTQPNQAYLMANGGNKYLLYITDQLGIQIDLREAGATFLLTWFDCASGDRYEGGVVNGGDTVSIEPPTRWGASDKLAGVRSWAATLTPI